MWKCGFVAFSDEIKNPPCGNVNMCIFLLARENPRAGGFSQVGVTICDLNWTETKIHRVEVWTLENLSKIKNPPFEFLSLSVEIW